MAGKRKEKENLKKSDRVESEVSIASDTSTCPGSWTCVVCCQKVPGPNRIDLFAVGPCDHIVCYECSTKMRVLCQQNECPICRQEIEKVCIAIFLFGRQRERASFRSDSFSRSFSSSFPSSFTSSFEFVRIRSHSSFVRSRPFVRSRSFLCSLALGLLALCRPLDGEISICVCVVMVCGALQINLFAMHALN